MTAPSPVQRGCVQTPRTRRRPARQQLARESTRILLAPVLFWSFFFFNKDYLCVSLASHCLFDHTYSIPMTGLTAPRFQHLHHPQGSTDCLAVRTTFAPGRSCEAPSPIPPPLAPYSPSPERTRALILKGGTTVPESNLTPPRTTHHHAHLRKTRLLHNHTAPLFTAPARAFDWKGGTTVPEPNLTPPHSPYYTTFSHSTETCPHHSRTSHSLTTRPHASADGGSSFSYAQRHSLGFLLLLVYGYTFHPLALLWPPRSRRERLLAAHTRYHHAPALFASFLHC